MKSICILDTMLSEEDKCRLQSCHTMIIDNLQQPDKVASFMHGKQALHKWEMEDVQAEKARWRKVQKLLDFVTGKHKGAYQVFLRAAERTGQHGLAMAVTKGDKHFGRFFILIYNIGIVTSGYCILYNTECFFVQQTF